MPCASTCTISLIPHKKLQGETSLSTDAEKSHSEFKSVVSGHTANKMSLH